MNIIPTILSIILCLFSIIGLIIEMFHEADREIEEIKLNTIKKDVEIKTEAIKQVIKNNGDISIGKHNARILASKKAGTVSVILQTEPEKIGVAFKLEDIKEVIKKLDAADEDIRK